MTKPRMPEFASYRMHSVLASLTTRLPFHMEQANGETIPEGTQIIKTRLREGARNVSVGAVVLDLPRIFKAHASELEGNTPPLYVVGITERACAEKIAEIIDIHFTPLGELAVPAYMGAEAVLGHAHRHDGQIGSLVVAHMTTDELRKYSDPQAMGPGWVPAS